MPDPPSRFVRFCQGADRARYPRSAMRLLVERLDAQRSGGLMPKPGALSLAAAQHPGGYRAAPRLHGRAERVDGHRERAVTSKA
jgi:hypothetical protein